MAGDGVGQQLLERVFRHAGVFGWDGPAVIEYGCVVGGIEWIGRIGLFKETKTGRHVLAPARWKCDTMLSRLLLIGA